MCNGFIHPFVVHPQIEPPNADLLRQWGTQESAFMTQTLEQCRGKCAADPACIAVSFSDPVKNNYPWPNCLPTMSNTPAGEFGAPGWECWVKGTGPQDAAAMPGRQNGQLALTLTSADPMYDGLELPPIRVIMEPAARLIASHVRAPPEHPPALPPVAYSPC